MSGNPIATTAGITTLRILKENADHIYPQIADATRQLADAARDTFGDSVQVNQVGSLMSVFFTKESVVDYNSATASDTEAYAAYFNAMLQQGIYLAPSQFESMFVSDAHTDADIQKTIHVMQEYFAE